jgi:hypothetical protein
MELVALAKAAIFEDRLDATSHGYKTELPAAVFSAGPLREQGDQVRGQLLVADVRVGTKVLARWCLEVLVK